ncbi:EAL domain-containing protein [Paraburkholderia aromaticivorans]|uniref:EAL domain-containing protein n=1 Tax=Paraburkholderia aromaticivorans TaxID=2026199 RepID=UPI001F0FD79A|nr:EAL domain-containing protein [Paraburkholderia aromaticivorans]
MSARYGYLAYLKRFEVDKLKIDRAFVRDLCQSGNDESIVRATIQMARALNLRTIAEGVEDEVTLACLRRLECDEVPGCLMVRLMPGDQVAAFICEHAFACRHRRRCPNPVAPWVERQTGRDGAGEWIVSCRGRAAQSEHYAVRTFI